MSHIPLIVYLQVAAKSSWFKVEIALVANPPCRLQEICVTGVSKIRINKLAKYNLKL